MSAQAERQALQRRESFPPPTGNASPAATPWKLHTAQGLVAALLLTAIVTAILVGPYPLTVGQALSALLGSDDPQARTVILQIRLPRVTAALLTGASLAAAGAAYQTLFRNPLVSPDILGVSAGAGLGAVLGIFLSLPVILIQLSAFFGGMAAVLVVAFIVRLTRLSDPTLALVLTGVVVGALAGAMTSLLKIMADPYDQLPAITFWLLGSLASITTADVAPVLPLVLLGLLPLILLRWRINLLAFGDEESRALGVEAGRLRIMIIMAATLITASVTAIAGVIGWVGLIIPHMARMLVGPGFSRLLPMSMALGAAYLLIIDTLARSLSSVETPIGILTAIIGAPFFVALLARGRPQWQ